MTNDFFYSFNVPDSVKPYFCGARLHAAVKKDGGLRPIAVGNLMRRLVSKLAAAAVFDKVQDHLSPRQVGVGTRGEQKQLYTG